MDDFKAEFVKVLECSDLWVSFEQSERFLKELRTPRVPVAWRAPASKVSFPNPNEQEFVYLDHTYPVDEANTKLWQPLYAD